MEILYAVLIVSGVGLIIGIALGVAGKILAVETDEREVAIRALELAAQKLPIKVKVVTKDAQ